MVRDYQWSIKELCEDINKTLEIDKDFPIAISGFPGSGKSTLADHLARCGDPNYKIKTHMIFTRKDLIDAINNLPPKSYIIIDEAVAVLFKRDFMQSGQKEVLKMLDICRYRNLVLIFCVPNFWALDNHLLGRIRMRIHIEKRGLGLIFTRSNNPWVQDCWFRKHNENTCWNWDYNPDATKAKGFMGLVRFGDMPEYAKKDYHPLKDEKRLLREQEGKEKKVDRVGVRERKYLIQLQKLMDHVVKMEFMTQGDIGKLLNRPRDSIYGFMNTDLKGDNPVEPENFKLKRDLIDIQEN